MSEKPIPIFVLGNHRSGTTWLANQLCLHPEVAGVQHDDHHGIHESAYFSCIVGRYGDLREKTNFVELVEVLAASDYCRIAGISKEFLFELWPTSYEDLFRSLMDAFARRSHAKYWVEKTPAHTEYVEDLARAYPDAYFVGVRRDLPSVVASSLNMDRHRSISTQAVARLKLMLTVSLRWTYFNRLLENFADRSERMLFLTYEEMRSDLPGVMERICEHIDAPFHAGLLESEFAANTSFESRGARDDALGKTERRVLALSEVILRLSPLRILRAVFERGHRLEGRQDLPPWFFKLHPFLDSEPSTHEALDSEKRDR